MSRLSLAKKTRAILYLVHQDLEQLWRPESRSLSETPLVAVDWSELYSYAAAQPPSEANVPPIYRKPELHYAALAYMFQRLECRLVLLPPYAWEMQNHLERLRHDALGVISKAGREQVADGYRALVSELRQEEKDNSGLQRFLANEDIGSERERKLLRRLERKIIDYVPSIYLSFQKATLAFVQAIRDLLGSTHKKRRIITLQELDPALAKRCEPALQQWKYWYVYMQNEREREHSKARNRIDSIALAYLEILHQEFFWSGRRLVFATRSPAMFRVMGYHPGAFPPSEEHYLDEGEHSYSAGRSWEYFAEIGYYLSKSRREQDLGNLILRKNRADWLIKALESEAIPSDKEQYERRFRNLEVKWGNLRGTFDLEGLGSQKHWKIRDSSSDDKLLRQLLDTFLSDKQPQEFLDRRCEIAEEVLKELDDVSQGFPRVGDLSGKPHRHFPLLPRSRLLRKSDVEMLEMIDAVTGYFEGEDAHRVRTLIGQVMRDEDSTETLEDLLQYASKKNAETADDRYLWIWGLGRYLLDHYKQAAEHFDMWLSAEDRPSAKILNLTGAFAAAALRHQGKNWKAWELLNRISDRRTEDLDADSELLRLNLKSRLIISWVEEIGEKQDAFPREEGRNVAQNLVEVFLRELAQSDSERLSVEPAFRMWCINNYIYLFARSVPFYEERLDWFEDRLPQTKTFVVELETYCKQEPVAKYLDTLGYYYFKAVFLERDHGNYDRSSELFEWALREARKIGDDESATLIRTHAREAKEIIDTVREERLQWT